jgi:hypothetical protein
MPDDLEASNDIDCNETVGYIPLKKLNRTDPYKRYIKYYELLLN